MELTLHCGILLVLFFLSGFFSSSETALFSLTKLDKRRLKEQYPNLSKWIFEHLQKPRKTLGTVLIGNLAVNTLATAIVTLIVLKVWGEKRLGLSMAVFTVFLVIFCELFPKIVAVRSRVKMALLVSMPLEFFSRIFAPLRLVMRFLTERILSLLIREKIEQSDMISEKELKVLVKIGEEEGVLGGQERYMIQKLLDLGERPVKDIMTPRTDMIGLDVEDPAEKHEESIRKYHFSQLPVFQGTPDHILGVVESQRYLLQDPRPELVRVMREALFVPESKRIDDLLETFRDKGENFAVCVDEFGGTAGVVTREDILEEIFGEFYDEYAKVENPIRSLSGNLYVVEGKVNLQEFDEYFSVNLVSEEATTLGGYLLEKMGVVPSKGARFETEDFEFTIQAMIRQRIHQVIVRRLR
ncbi:MAG TPA: hemolysin family protein [Candidatus Omnitrophota bacterium]|nr:hemolysin family protein [Candidatus Omnitrophota bacterium]HPS36459.1 hemolysin family protein [Candidatus Omnitrophota bacterium]